MQPVSFVIEGGSDGKSFAEATGLGLIDLYDNLRRTVDKRDEGI